MDRFGQILWDANLGFAAILLIRIILARFYRIFPLLSAYFAVYLIAGVGLMRIPLRTELYAYTYIISQLALHTLALLVVLELYRAALAKHPGLASFGRASVLIVALATFAVVTIGSLFDKDILSGQSAILHRFFTLERSLELITVLFLVAIAVFITWFPVDLSRNVALSIGAFAAYYFVRAIALLAVNLLPPTYFLPMNDAMFVAAIAILAGWSLLLRSTGAASEPLPGRGWDSAALARATHQLDAINSALVRFGKR